MDGIVKWTLTKTMKEKRILYIRMTSFFFFNDFIAFTFSSIRLLPKGILDMYNLK